MSHGPYLLQLHQEGDVVALLGREAPVGREDAQPLGRFARALLRLGRVALPHPVRAVVGNNLPVPAKGDRVWEPREYFPVCSVVP